MTKSSSCEAPARRFTRAGVLLLIVLSSGACDRGGIGAGDEGPRVLELTGDTIRLEAGVRLIDVAVERSGTGEFEPASIEASQGDVVRFTAQDHGGHAIVFDAATIPPDAAAYLERTGQMRAPPLIERGSAWVITLDDAPAGVYSFRCATHGTSGQLTIRAR